MNCGTCRFFDDIGGDVGSCKRYPPQIAYTQEVRHQLTGRTVQSPVSFSPPVKRTDACGEHRPRITDVQNN